MKLTGQRILLTGGTSGLGLALLHDLHRRGNQLTVIGRNTTRMAELQQMYPDVTFLRCDLSSAIEVVHLLQTLQHDTSTNASPAYSVLINNAGVQYAYELGNDDQATEKIDTEIQTNLTSVIQLCNGLLPILKKQPVATIINITSGLGISPKRSAPVYCATKAGLQIFTKALRYQLAGSSIEVVDVVLPLVDTPMTAGRGTGKISPEQAASELIRGIERGQSIIDVGKVNVFRIIHRIAPRLADQLLKNG